MSGLRFVLRRFFKRRNLESELNEELASHIAMETALRVQQGERADAARQQALRQFGNSELIAEVTRRQWGFTWLEQTLSDFRFAWRQTARSPRLTAVVISTLGIGIGALGTIYSVVHAVLIDPYPYRDAMRMVHLHLYDKEPTPFDLGLTGAQFIEFEKSPVLDGAVADDAYTMSLTGGDLPEQLRVGRMSSNAFQFFGVPAQLGREFGPSDSSRVTVLSYQFWESHFAGRSDAIGRILQLNRENYTIVGVMPARFAWIGSELYVPLAYSSDPRRPASVYARVRAGVADKAAEEALQPMLDAFAKETPANFPVQFKLHLVPINEIAIGRFRDVLIALFTSVSLLLFLACVNTAILLLARGEARQSEIAMRKALGASRRRVTAQLLAESMLLSSIGGCCGVMLTSAGVHSIRHLIQPLPTLFPPEAEIQVNFPVLLFSLGISLLTGVLCGLWPALRASGIGLSQAMNNGVHKLAGRKGMGSSHVVLLTIQVAATILLLGCSGATLRKLFVLLHTNIGYDPQNLASVSLVMREGAHDQWADRVHYYEQIREAIAADPDVVSAAIGVLPSMNLESTPLNLPGSKESGSVVVQQVGSEYFRTTGIPLLLGRIWTQDESTHAAHLALINQCMQRQYWSDRSPIGQTLVLNHGVANGDVWKLVAPGDNQTFQIAGVVGNVPNRGLDEATYPQVYIPYSMTPYDGFDVAFRARRNPSAMLHALKVHVRNVDANQAVGAFESANDLMEGDSLGREQFTASLFSAFGLLALAFAVSGIFSVQSYLVSQRRREFGVRIALGAKRFHIAFLVTKSCLLAVLCGTALGLVLVGMFDQIFVNWTNADARDPLILSSVVLLFLFAATAASVLPARIAANTAPMEALRSE